MDPYTHDEETRVMNDFTVQVSVLKYGQTLSSTMHDIIMITPAGRPFIYTVKFWV